MPRSQIRLLLIVTVAAGLGDLALIGRSRSRPTLQPRVVESEQRPADPAAALAGGGSAPSSSARVPTQQREHETTVRPRPAGTPSQAPLPQARAVEAVQRSQLITLVEEAISKTSRRYLDVADYTPWQIMHGVLALRSDYKLKSQGKLVSGIEFISSGPKFRGDYWWEKTSAGGRGHPYSVPYHFEGHINQFPALLCMSALPLDHKLVAKGGTITVADIVRNAQRTVNTNEEISWTLWFLTQYVSQDAEWSNQNGQRWSMAELVRLQVAADVNSGPCGGTHGLFAQAISRNAYLRQHGQLRGPYVNSEYKLRQHIELARNLQNADGSFSTNWFKGRGYTNDFKERIKCSGHMLEWLMMALPASRLDEAWVRRGIQSVANDLLRNATAPAECGPMYHALHALVLYKDRVAPNTTPAPVQELASQPVPATPAATPKVAATAPAVPTDPALLPPLPAQSASRPGVPPAIAAPATVKSNPAIITPAAPSAPGIVQLSPAAPATTSRTMPDSAPQIVAVPAIAPSTAPGILAPNGAKPLVVSSEQLPGDMSATPPAAAPVQPPLLTLQPPTPAVSTPAHSPDAAAPLRVPVEIAAHPPADLPPGLGATASNPPAALPPAIGTVPQMAQPADTVTQAETPEPLTVPGTLSAPLPPVIAENTPTKTTSPPSATDDLPILPKLALDAPEPAPQADQPITGLTIEAHADTVTEKPSAKPAIDAAPAVPVRIAAEPAAAESDTQ